MPSRYLYVVKVGKKLTEPDEAFVVAAYGREEAVELALGKYADIQWDKNGKSQSVFRVGSMEGEVLVCWSWQDRKMIRKTEKNFYVQVRDGYVFRDEDELRSYLNKFKYLPELRDYVVFIDRFGRRENVKSWSFS